MIAKLPEPSANDNVVLDVNNVDKKFDDEMWTYLKGVKVDTNVLESSSIGVTKDNFSAALQNSFSGPSGDSSLSTHSTDNSGGSLSYGKKRSATLNHAKTSPRGEAVAAGVTSTTMQARRWETGNRRRAAGTASRKSDNSGRVFENPLDRLECSPMMTSDSDYMSVNDSLLRHSDRRAASTNNTHEPIYHTLEDDDDCDVLSSDHRTATSVTLSSIKKDPNDATVYINADLEVVYPPLPQGRRDFVSDEDDDAEFEHLLRSGSVTRQNGDGDTDCDEYENEDLLQRQHSYVPSPAPGSFPRQWLASNATPKTTSRSFYSEQASFSPRLTQGRRPASGVKQFEQFRQLQQQQQQHLQQQQRRASQQQQQQQFNGYLI